MAKRAENWVSIRWIGRYDGIIYDINRRNINAKLPFELGQIVELKKLKGMRPGQKGEIMMAQESLYWQNKISRNIWNKGIGNLRSKKKIRQTSISLNITDVDTSIDSLANSSSILHRKGCFQAIEQ